MCRWLAYSGSPIFLKEALSRRQLGKHREFMLAKDALPVLSKDARYRFPGAFLDQVVAIDAVPSQFLGDKARHRRLACAGEAREREMRW